MSLGDQVDRFLSEMHFLSPGLSLEGKSGHRWVTWGQHMAVGVYHGPQGKMIRT